MCCTKQRSVEKFNTMTWLQSLHAKILLGYGIVGLLFVVLVAGAVLHFRGLEEQIADQQRFTAFYDSIRHARRMEKNFLLYRKKADLSEAIAKADNAAALLNELPVLPTQDNAQQQEIEILQHYRELLAELAVADRRARPSPETVEALIEVGTDLLNLGEKLDARARTKLDAAIATHHRDLLLAVVAALVFAVVAGTLVTRSVARPLRRIESSLRRVATGETGRLDRFSGDREVESLTEAINRMLSEIESRQKNVARSSRLVALGTMLSGVAHELNNPLSNISTSCQILLEEIGEIDAAEARELLELIDGQVLRAQRIVDALLDFARDRQFERRNEALRPLADEALLLLRNELASEPPIELRIPPDLGIDVDRQRFQQVLLNLLKNAVDAAGPNGHVILTARAEGEGDGRGVTVTVEDDGPGIDASALPRIFDPFYSTKPVGAGTGLGLFVVHEIVTQHGGSVTVDSETDAGCRFRVHIPAREAQQGKT